MTGLPPPTTSIRVRDFELVVCRVMCRCFNYGFEKNTAAGRTTGRFHGKRMLLQRELLGEVDPDAAGMLSGLDPVAV